MTNETDEKECRERLAELEEENGHLRAAAARFAELAERLSRQLTEERRGGSDRPQYRSEPR
jgi:hypothetical protein